MKRGRTEGVPTGSAPPVSRFPTRVVSAGAGVARFRVLFALGVLGLLVPAGVTFVSAAGPAAALSTTAPTAPAPASPTPQPTDSPGGPGPIADPAITSPANSRLLSGPFVIQGSAQPGSRVQVSASSRSDPLCATTADASGAFRCDAGTLPSAQGVQLRVVQVVDGYDNRSDSVRVNILNAPTAQSGSAGGVSTGYGTVRGVGYSGAQITATATGAPGTYSCAAIADGGGGWACNLGAGIPSGTLQLSATQQTSWSGGSSAASPAVPMMIDSEIPSPPRVTSPSAGGSVPASGAAFSGAGESDALVTVFAGVFAACTADVQNGAWSCSASALTAGSVAISAIQQDAAGNVSDESTPFSVTVRGSAATPSPSGSAVPNPGQSGAAGGAVGSGSTGSGAGSGRPGDGTGSAGTGAPGTGGAGSGTGGSGGSGDTGGTGSGGSGLGDAAPGTGGTGASGGAAPGAPGDSAASGHPLADGSWAGSTRFTAALQPVFGSSAALNWLIALAIGAAALLLVAAPAKLLVHSLSLAAHTRRQRRGTLLTGRNRSREEFERAPELAMSPWVLAGVSLVASAAIGMLSGPVESQPAYLRLLAAICIAFAVLNLVSVGVPKLVGERMLGIRLLITFAPRYLAFAAVASLACRVFQIEPALLFGLVLAIGCVDGAAPRALGQFALLHLGSLLALGGVAWGVSSLLPLATTAGGAFAAEVLHTLVIGSFGTAAVLSLPFGHLSGKALSAWSRAAWLATTLGTFTLLAAASSTLPSAPAPSLAPLLLTAVAFAAVSVSVWAWVRFVVPTLR